MSCQVKWWQLWVQVVQERHHCSTSCHREYRSSKDHTLRALSRSMEPNCILGTTRRLGPTCSKTMSYSTPWVLKSSLSLQPRSEPLSDRTRLRNEWTPSSKDSAWTLAKIKGLAACSEEASPMEKEKEPPLDMNWSQSLRYCSLMSLLVDLILPLPWGSFKSLKRKLSEAWQSSAPFTSRLLNCSWTLTDASLCLRGTPFTMDHLRISWNTSDSLEWSRANTKTPRTNWVI